MDWQDTVFELINMRSFNNLWYWILLALVWSAAGQRVLDVPWDMVIRARRGQDAAAMADLSEMLRITVSRRLRIVDQSGPVLTGLAGFVVTSLALLAVLYGNEFAQAVLLLAGPLMGVAALSLRTARRIRDAGLDGPPLVKAVTRLRTQTQAIGMVAIFVTAMWGMYKNMNAYVLG
ncbi:component of SufBCD complex [Roseovarius sp. D22-M7]|uniref:component of SufBCD complex n=1 Tax=Roseovarius sp. D22-M7 TaxID=3127116 RepID=UPI00300FC372